jgi:hypothetical protein
MGSMRSLPPGRMFVRWPLAGGLWAQQVHGLITQDEDSRHYGSNVAGTAQIVRWFSQLAR